MIEEEYTHKICIKCNNSKAIEHFGLCSNNKDGLLSSCKECVSLYQKEKYTSVESLIARIYNAQISSSKKRGHNPPSYTKSELQEWILSRDNFEYLYLEWVKSGYDMWLKPSIDRLKNDKGYYFGNIQLITWKENHSKPKKESLNKTTKISISISEENYNHIGDYAKKTGRSRSKAISMAVSEFLDKHNPNYKQKKILENYGSSKK